MDRRRAERERCLQMRRSGEQEPRLLPGARGPGAATAAGAAADREHDEARRHPERETLELATAGAAQVLGVDHSATKALARASITMAKADLWRARLAVKTLRRDQRAAIAGVGDE